MTSSKKTFLLLDGNALLHRAWHAIPPLTTASGQVVNAAYGFSMVLEKMLEEYHPDSMVVAWDLPGETFRHKEFPAYKAQREKKAQELYDQIPLIQEILTDFGIPSVSLPNYEADDVLGTLSARAAKKGYDVLIVTSDQDALQLVDEHVHVLAFIKGLSETKTYDPKAVKERFGLEPNQLIEYKALRGDTSDNLPGVVGVGEKTATDLLRQFETVDGIFKAIKKGEVPEKFAKKFVDQEETALHMRHLVTIVRDAPLAFDLKDAALKPIDWNKVVAKYRALEFRTLIRKHATEVAPPPLEENLNETKSQEPKNSNKKINIVKALDEFEEALKLLKNSTVAISVIPQPADLFGSGQKTLVVSDGAHTIVALNADKKYLAAAFEKISQAELVVAHDIKQTMHLTGWLFSPKIFDVMLASYLLHAGTRAHDISAIVLEQLKLTVPELPLSIANEKDAKLLATSIALFPALVKAMTKQLSDEGMKKVFEEIELPLVPILYEMEATGIELDSHALDAFAKKLGKRIETLTKKIIDLAGVEFNVNSPSQLADVLFSNLNLPTKGIKKTTSGFSTAASELEKLEDAHEIVPLISEYREIAKLQSTYAESLPKLVGKDGRIHTSFNQAVAATGRLSSSDPNLQNIPIRTDLGNEIRKAFVAGKGKKLVAADFSQIELRIMAVMAKDEPFIRAFNDGADIHTRTASEIWEIPEEKVTPEQRRHAKAINFGLLYGMGPRALARSTGMTFEEAQTFIEKYFKIHHAVRAFMDAQKAQAHALGYVETLYGRRRSFPEINSGVPMLVAQAERMAINMPVQGTEADIVKIAMIAVDAWLKKSGLPAQLLLQVHDELVVECETGAVEKVKQGIKEVMETVVKLDVPLDVDVEVGKNWGEMT